MISLAGKPGSVLDDGSFSVEGAGRPGVWTKDVVEGVVVATLAPPSGSLASLLRPATSLIVDSRLEEVRRLNPCCRPGK